MDAPTTLTLNQVERGFTLTVDNRQGGQALKTWAFSTVDELVQWLKATYDPVP